MIKRLFTRIKNDWIEYFYYKRKERMIRRTEKALQSEVDYALMLNKETGKTYYIFINENQVPEAMDNLKIKDLKRIGKFPDWAINKILEHALIIVQSQNEIIRHQEVNRNESIMKN